MHLGLRIVVLAITPAKGENKPIDLTTAPYENDGLD